MASERLQLKNRPVRKAILPFFYTAPLSLIGVGGLLLFWGLLALSTPWSGYALALTHVFTLGFLTMSCVGLVYLLLAVLGSVPTVSVRVSHSVYWLLLAGAAGLVWGAARGSAGPVSFAIASVGAMAVLFLVHASRAWRRTPVRGLTRRGLGLALWGFFGLSFLGIWIAHGHADMLFPGPRTLWTQVHVLVGLLAWVGALVIAFSSEIWPHLQGGRSLAPRALAWLMRLIMLGLSGSLTLLIGAYFFLADEGVASLTPWVALLLSPMALAVWLLHPGWALRSVAGVPANGGLLFWRTGLGLGPFVLISGIVAWVLGEPRLIVLFGWLALYGWAGLLICALLVGAVPQLLGKSRPTGVARKETWLRLGFGLHVAALIVGSVGIVTQRDDWIRVAGALVLVHGLELGVWLLRNLRSSAGDPSAPS